MTNEQFARFVQEHARIINKVCWVYASAELPYEDLRQEIYTNLWLGIDKFRNECKLSTWVYRVSVNSALTILRSSKPKLNTICIDDLLVDPSNSFDQEKVELLKELREVIAHYPPIDKALMLMWLDGYVYEEIAESLGLSKTNVATKLSRIKQSIIHSIK